ncbi:MAG: TrkH family potassium uptake protein [Solirubrobacteraceae bacterium]
MRLRSTGFGPQLNWRLIVPILGGVLLAVSLAMVICLVAAVIAGDGAVLAFGLPAAIGLPLSILLLRSARLLRSIPLRPRDGFVAVTMAWVIAAAAGMAPFLLHGTFDQPVDAFFESMSGFTTTGATLLDDIEGQPQAILLWRSMSQWLGGVGIVVLVVAIAPATGLATKLFSAETSRLTDRLTPRIADTAKIIWGIYLVLTAGALVAYAAAGMGLFDALNHGMTTVATGGFSTKNASMAAFDSTAIEVVAIIFMLAGGVNFAFYWRAIRGMDLWPQAAEVRAYLLIVIAATVALTLTLIAADATRGFGIELRDAAFSATSVMTSTGYTTADFDDWNDTARWILLMLMFVGGCAGSTSGGMKVIRIMLLGKTASQEVQRQLRPSAVQVLRTRRRVFGEDIRRAVLGLFLLYMALTAATTFALLICGMDLLSAASGAASAVNIVGPAFGDLGASDNYTALPEAGRWILSVVMLAGRLEIFTVLVLLTPAFWRPSVA